MPWLPKLQPSPSETPRVASAPPPFGGLLGLAALVGLVGACASAPPPAPPPRPPPAPVVAPPPKPPPVVEKPPPKKCVALAEECIADKWTLARIAHAPLVFTPADGWAYAEEADATVMENGEGGPTLALAGYEIADPKAAPAARDAALLALLARLSITPPKDKISWGTPLSKGSTAADVHVVLYQVEGAQRAGKKGPLLVMTSSQSTSLAVLGVGFVANDDKTNADDAILQSIGSLAPRPASMDAAPDATSSKPDTTKPDSIKKKEETGK